MNDRKKFEVEGEGESNGEEREKEKALMDPAMNHSHEQ